MNLKELFWSKGYDYYPTDKDVGHNFLSTYSEMFQKFEHEPINILEVGSFKGGCMRLFEEYFTKANVVSYDIKDYGDTRCKRAVRIIKDFTQVVSSELPEITIAIEDGAHDIDSQFHFVQHVWPRMKLDGIMVIEDIFTSELDKTKSRMNSLQIPYQTISFTPQIDEDNDNIMVFRKIPDDKCKELFTNASAKRQLYSGRIR